MTLRKRPAFGILIAALAIAGGCSGKTINLAPHLPASQLAVVTPNFLPGIRAVDGEFCETGGLAANTLLLPAGEREFLVVANSGGGQAGPSAVYTWRVRYTLEPGHVYKLHTNWFYQGLKFIDQGTGVSVVLMR
jgi:hypothetical protein